MIYYDTPSAYAMALDIVELEQARKDAQSTTDTISANAKWKAYKRKKSQLLENAQNIISRERKNRTSNFLAPRS